MKIQTKRTNSTQTIRRSTLVSHKHTYIQAHNIRWPVDIVDDNSTRLLHTQICIFYNKAVRIPNEMIYLCVCVYDKDNNRDRWIADFCK